MCILYRSSCSKTTNVEHIGKENVVRKIPISFHFLWMKNNFKKTRKVLKIILQCQKNDNICDTVIVNQYQWHSIGTSYPTKEINISGNLRPNYIVCRNLVARDTKKSWVGAVSVNLRRKSNRKTNIKAVKNTLLGVSFLLWIASTAMDNTGSLSRQNTVHHRKGEDRKKVGL